MTQNIILTGSIIAVIGCGLVAGVFLTFSDFVMKSFAALPPVQGTEVMQVINRKVYGSVFLVLLLAMTGLCLLLGIVAFFNLSAPASKWVIAGSALYTVTVFACTIIFNVPMNNRLDNMNSTSPETAVYWSTYMSTWTGWNHVRTIGSTGAMTCFLIGCIMLGRTAAF